MGWFQAKALYDCGMGPWSEARNKYLSSAAEMGYAPAQYALAYYCYYSGNGGPRDDAQAVKFFTLAADQNHTEAVFMLGYMHYNGRGGLPRDLQRAKEILSRPAVRNHAHAKRLLADIEHSEQEQQHALDVVESVRRAADGGDAEAQLQMARYYKSGTDAVRRDAGKGLGYLRLSAEQGLPAAQLLLGRSYDNALFDLREDCAAALVWYRRAADHLDTGAVALGAKTQALRELLR